MRAKDLLVDVENVTPEAIEWLPPDPFKLHVIDLAGVTSQVIMGFLNSAGKPT